MEQKVIQIGNSLGIILPAELRNKAKIKKGSTVFIDIDEANGNLLITKNVRTTVTPEFLEILDSVNDRYGRALQDLAKR